MTVERGYHSRSTPLQAAIGSSITSIIVKFIVVMIVWRAWGVETLFFWLIGLTIFSSVEPIFNVWWRGEWHGERETEEDKNV